MVDNNSQPLNVDFPFTVPTPLIERLQSYVQAPVGVAEERSVDPNAKVDVLA